MGYPPTPSGWVPAGPPPPGYRPPPGHLPLPGFAPAPGYPPPAYPSPPGFAPAPGHSPPGYPSPLGSAPSPGYLPPPHPPPPGSGPTSGYPPPPGGWPAPGLATPGQPAYALPYPAYAFPTWAWTPPAVGWGRFRAQSFGELLDSAFTVYRRRFLAIVAIMALFQLPYLTVEFFSERSVLSYLPSFGSTTVETPAQLQSQLNGILGALLVVLAVTVAYYLFLLPLAEGAVIKVVSDDYLDRKSSVGSALGLAFHRIVPLIGFVLLGLAIALAPLVVVVGLSVLAGGGAGAAIAVVLFLAWLVYVVFVGIRLSLGVQALVLEKLGPMGALRRSFQLTQGSFWRIFLFYLVMLLVSGIVGELLQALFSIFIQGLSQDTQLMVSSLAGGVVGILTSPFILILLTLVYYDVRIRREAFDLEMLAQSL
ncbi:MAG TPA: hypothetical protein VEK76_13310 [Candidatus Binatia bacterium]|nr:hypothetical protein [Candidatus Binatia bacterium]